LKNYKIGDKKMIKVLVECETKEDKIELLNNLISSDYEYEVIDGE